VLLTVKLRYKDPDADTSKLLAVTVRESAAGAASKHLAFASAVAGFGMPLRDSEHKGSLSYAQVKELASRGLLTDPHGYRAEFVRLVAAAEALAGGQKIVRR